MYTLIRRRTSREHELRTNAVPTASRTSFVFVKKTASKNVVAKCSRTCLQVCTQLYAPLTNVRLVIDIELYTDYNIKIRGYIKSLKDPKYRFFSRFYIMVHSCIVDN